MKLSRPLILIILFIVVLLVVKLIFLDGASQTTTGTAPKNQAVLVSAYIAKSFNLSNKVYASGTVLANEEVELKPEASGKILKILFSEGTSVSKGNLLVKINDADLQAQLKKLKLQVLLASEQERRQKKLLDIQGVSQEEYDIVLNQLNALKTDEEHTQALIGKTELRAPFSGVIGLKNVSEGSYVSPVQPIAWLQQIDPVKIDFSIPEKYASMIQTGDKIQFTSSNSSENFTGVVYAVEPRIDHVTRTLQVRAISPNKSGKIIPGAFVKIELVLQEIQDAILIPTQAIVPVLKGKNVFIYKNGKAETQKVETGIRNDSSVQVIKGIEVGDTVITTGIMQLRPGMNAKITEIK